MAPVGSGRTRLRNQMHRLFNAAVQLAYSDAEGEASMGGVVASRIELWWNPKRPDQPTLWESRIRLGEDLFEEIICNPIPIEMNTLKALKRSPLGLDLYLWLTYRVFSLEKPISLPWKRLHRQFGAHPGKADDRFVVMNFRKNCLRELVKIHTAWPEFRYSTAKGHLVLFPSRPLISPTKGKERSEIVPYGITTADFLHSCL